ncbi:MAG: diol dehydratase small subunit [Rhodospirillales bacterium]
MSDKTPGIADYPLAEKRPDLVRTADGKPLDALTLEAVESGEVGMESLAITPTALRQQAAVARAAGRETLAQNFERGAELVAVPQEVIMAAYELLRPGRAESKQSLLEMAARLRDDYAAPGIAAFLEEAAEVYEARGLFTYRF